MKKILNWLLDKWLAGFITAALFFLLKLYLDLPHESRESITDFSWMKSILNYNVPLASVIILILIIVIITRLEKSLAVKKTKQKNVSNVEPENPAINYTSDFFGVKGQKWTWGYEWDSYERKINIINLKPTCPNCGSSMDITEEYYL